MGNCLSANTDRRDGLHKLEASLVCKGTQTDKNNDDESDKKAEKVSKDKCQIVLAQEAH